MRAFTVFCVGVVVLCFSVISVEASVSDGGEIVGGACPDCTGRHDVSCQGDGSGLPCNQMLKNCWVDSEYDPLKECFTAVFDPYSAQDCQKRTLNGCMSQAHEGCRLCGS